MLKEPLYWMGRVELRKLLSLSLRLEKLLFIPLDIDNIVLEKKQINMSQLIDEIDLHKNTILYHLNILIREGKIIRKGKGKNTFYIIRTT